MGSRTLSAAVAIAALLVGLAWQPATGGERPPTTAPESPAEPTPRAVDLSRCTVRTTAMAWPRVVLLGETVTVTRTAEITCYGRRGPRRVVLVMDGSAGMAGAPSEAMKRLAGRLVEKTNDNCQLCWSWSVVEFDGSARRRCTWPRETREVRSCLGGVAASGLSRLETGIAEGARVLIDARDGSPQRESPEVLIVFSGTENATGCAPVRQAAARARGAGSAPRTR